MPPKRNAKTNREQRPEPHASPFSDEDRNQLGVENAMNEIQRATRKEFVAQQQIAGGSKVYDDPEARQESARATVDILRSKVEDLANMGTKFAHPRKPGAFDELGEVMREIVRSQRKIGLRGMVSELAILAR